MNDRGIGILRDRTNVLFRKRLRRWIEQTDDACMGKHGSHPYGRSLEYWRGRRSALKEAMLFVPSRTDPSATPGK